MPRHLVTHLVTHLLTRLMPHRLAIIAAVCWIGLPAHADTFGGIGLTSDNIERGVSLSERKPSLQAHLGWRAAAGPYLSLGAASVSKTQFVGSHGYKLMPELGFATDIDAAQAWRAGLSLRGQLFPGARGPWFGQLPGRLQNLAVQAKDSDYSTVELAGSLSWKLATLSVARSLTDYLGLAARQTGPLGTRLLESKGTTYIALDADWPIGQDIKLSGGLGRLQVPNFEELGYTDWRLGASFQASSLAPGLRLGLQASGSNANSGNYSLRDRLDNSPSNARQQALVASLAWSF